MSDYENRQRAQGALFKNRRTKRRSPALTGSLTIYPGLIPYILQEYEAGNDVTLQLAAWQNRCGESGTEYLTVIAQPPYDYVRSAKRKATPKRPDNDECALGLSALFEDE